MARPENRNVTDIMKTLITPNPLSRHDPSIVNVLLMLRPILEEKDLVGSSILATDLARICRNHKSRLPFRSYNGLRMAEEIEYLGSGGSIEINDLEVSAAISFDPATRRRFGRITFEKGMPEDQLSDSQLQILHQETHTF